jgi:GT2 family glycosyltransferase
MAAPSLSATLVTYRTPSGELRAALASLGESVAQARGAGLLGAARVYVVDNSPADEHARIAADLAAWPAGLGDVELLAGHGNLGYGRANNLVLSRLTSDFHLVMNPDIEVDPGALAAALRAFEAHPEAGLMAPAVRSEDGAVLYLCKRYPSVWVLFLRGFAPRFLRERHREALERYEMRDLVGERYVGGVTLASGAFMLLRTALFKRLGGFDPRYFMYFEDYDLSMRAAREADVAFVPAARVVHHGGEAARKGLRHVIWFVASAARFFAAHGWKLR